MCPSEVPVMQSTPVLADMPTCSLFVRFRGQSGHWLGAGRCPLLTQKRTSARSKSRSAAFSGAPCVLSFGGRAGSAVPTRFRTFAPFPLATTTCVVYPGPNAPRACKGNFPHCLTRHTRVRLSCRALMLSFSRRARQIAPVDVGSPRRVSFPRRIPCRRTANESVAWSRMSAASARRRSRRRAGGFMVAVAPACHGPAFR